MTHVHGVDHALVGVRDLEGACATWRALGFTLSPRGRHIGWGTGNYCIMFPNDYIELLGVVDPSGDLRGLDAMLQDGDGLLGLAFAGADIDAVFADLQRADLAGDPPVDLGRYLDLPGGAVTASFRLVHPRNPGGDFGFKTFTCKHLTPDIVWRPDWLAHANTARGIAAITATVQSVDAVVPAYQALLGAEAVQVDGDGAGAVIQAGRASLRLVATDDPRGLIGLGLAVADLTAAQACLQSAAIPFERDGDGLHIRPEHTTGVALSLVPL